MARPQKRPHTERDSASKAQNQTDSRNHVLKDPMFVYHVLYTMYYILYTVYCILNITFQIQFVGPTYGGVGMLTGAYVGPSKPL